HGTHRSSRPNLRRRRRGGRPCRSRHGGVCGLRGPVGDRLRRGGVRRPGGGERAHRELSRIPRGDLRAGPHGPRVRGGPEVRRPGLAATSSRCPIDPTEATPNIAVLTRTEVVALIGAPGPYLERVRWRRTTTGEETELPIHNLFLFVGADPATQWLQGCGVAL